MPRVGGFLSWDNLVALGFRGRMLVCAGVSVPLVRIALRVRITRFRAGCALEEIDASVGYVDRYGFAAGLVLGVRTGGQGFLIFYGVAGCQSRAQGRVSLCTRCEWE